MPTVFLGGPVVLWNPLESSPEPESPDGTPYWQSPESGYPGTIVEQPSEPDPDPGPGAPAEPVEPDPVAPEPTGGE